jgi:hypothetical protein
MGSIKGRAVSALGLLGNVKGIENKIVDEQRNVLAAALLIPDAKERLAGSDLRAVTRTRQQAGR